MTVKKVKDIVVKKDTRSSPIVTKKKVIPKPIEIISNVKPKRELTIAESKVYKEKLNRGVSPSHPSMPGNEKSFTSKQLFIIPNEEISKDVEIVNLDKEIKHHIIAMSKIDYKKYPLEIVKGILNSILMSRNTIETLKSSKK